MLTEEHGKILIRLARQVIEENLELEASDPVSADELAKWLETISYEVLCLLGTFNEKFYI